MMEFLSHYSCTLPGKLSLFFLVAVVTQLLHMGWLCESFLSPHNGTACMVKEEGWLSWASAGTLSYIPTGPVDTSV